MAVPPISAPCWSRLANGGLERINTDHLGTKMLVKRLQMSGASVAAKAQEIHAYYAKWERGLANEIAQFA